MRGLIGATVGPYRIDSEIGAGGMGSVFLARVTGETEAAESGTFVALKLVHEHLLERAEVFERFRREADLGRTIRHENLVRTLDADSWMVGDRQIGALVMEYVEGRTLRALLSEWGRVPEELCRYIGREVAQALVEIHAAGVVHRDLKPENILLSWDDTVKVMDLGVARVLDEAIRLSRTGAFLGSVLYAAPEQFGAAGTTVDGRADLYSLGLTLYELSTGTHPFRTEDLGESLRLKFQGEIPPAREINPGITPFFSEVLSTLLAEDPGERFADADELRSVLEEGEASTFWIRRLPELSATEAAAFRLRAPREASLVGRETELRTLRSAYDAAIEGGSRTVLLIGEAGVGKTRLVEEFALLLLQGGAHLDYLSAASSWGSPGAPVGGLLGALADHLRQTGLREEIRDRLSGSSALADALCRVMESESGGNGNRGPDEELVTAGVLALLRSLAAEAPLLLFLDDLDRGPRRERELFEAISRASIEEPILLVGTARQAVEMPLPLSAETLVLERLGARDAGRLVAGWLGSEDVAQRHGFDVVVRSDGNPRKAVELLRRVQVAGDLGAPDPQARSTKEFLQERIAATGEEEKEVLGVAACAGLRFDPFLVADAIGMTKLAAIFRLARIEKNHGLVRSRGHSFEFDHAEVRDEILASLPGGLRQIYHLSLARCRLAREDNPSSVEGEAAVEVARHLFAGGQPEKGHAQMASAIRHLERGYRHEEIVELLSRALSSTEDEARRTEYEILRAGHLDRLGRHGEARESLERALDSARKSGDADLGIRALLRLGQYHLDHQEYSAAVDVCRRALQDARARGDAFLVSWALEVLGFALGVTGELEHGVGLLEEALEHALASGDRERELSVHRRLGTLLLEQGRWDEARAQYEREYELSEELGDPRSKAAALSMLANILCHLGRLSEGREHYEQAIALARELGAPYIEVSATGNLGEIVRALGNAEGAIPHYERQLELALEIGQREQEARAVAGLGSAYHSLGRLEEALQHRRRHLDLVRATGDATQEAGALNLLGILESALGDLDGGLRTLERALDVARRVGTKRWEGLTLMSIANTLEELGRLEEALPLAEEAIETLQAASDHFTLAPAETVRGRILAGLGRTEEAVRAFEKVRDLGDRFEEPGSHALGAAWLASLGALETDEALRIFRGREEGMESSARMECCWLLHRATGEREFLIEAGRMLRMLRDQAPTAYREGFVANVSLRREIEARNREA